VLIRPRAGDFFYSDDDFKRMRDEINAAKRLGANGVVFGILNRDCSVDTERCKELIEFASPIVSVFHRAFDVVSNPFIALDELIGLGFSHVLTSGQKETVADGISLIRQLVQHADHRITILAGGGITEENIAELVAQSGTNEFHFSAKVEKEGGEVLTGYGKARRIRMIAETSWKAWRADT
jgi:copper homeostasis protein